MRQYGLGRGEIEGKRIYGIRPFLLSFSLSLATRKVEDYCYRRSPTLHVVCLCVCTYLRWPKVRTIVCVKSGRAHVSVSFVTTFRTVGRVQWRVSSWVTVSLCVERVCEAYTSSSSSRRLSHYEVPPRSRNLVVRTYIYTTREYSSVRSTVCFPRANCHTSAVTRPLDYASGRCR